MALTSLLMLIWLFGLGESPAAAQTPEWPFDAVYDSDPVFLHPLANYRPNPHWLGDWERGRASGSSVWATALSLGTSRWRAWPGLHLLTQRANAEGRENERFERTDLMPQVFVEYGLGESDALEFGFMGTRSDRSSRSEDPQRSFDRLAWSDKIKLGWTHSFAPAAHIQLSLSHEVAPDRFGGRTSSSSRGSELPPVLHHVDEAGRPSSSIACRGFHLDQEIRERQPADP